MDIYFIKMNELLDCDFIEIFSLLKSAIMKNQFKWAFDGGHFL